MKMLLLLFLFSLSPNITYGGISFIESYKKAIKLAKEQNKLIFMDFTAKWCGPCKTMEKEVFSKDSIGNYYNNHFINLKIDSDRKKNIFRKFGIKSMPTMLFIDKNGEVLHTLTRTKDPYFFMKESRSVYKSYHNYKEALDQLSKLDKNDNLDSLFTHWHDKVGDGLKEKIVNESHDISDRLRSFIQENYLISLDENRFQKTLLNIDKKLLVKDDIRDILAFKLYIKDLKPELRNIKPISKQLREIGFNHVEKSEAYLALQHYLFFKVGEQNIGEKSVSAKKYLLTYPDSWDYKLSISALDIIMSEKTDLLFIEKLHELIKPKVEETKNSMLLNIYTLTLYILGEKEKATALVPKVNSLAKGQNIYFKPLLNRYREELEK